MAMRGPVREIELRRLTELEKQAAMHGPKTDPAILLEIQELHHRYPEARRNDHAFYMATLDYEFLMNVVASALSRLTIIEKNKESDDKQRKMRQLLQDIWMALIAVVCLATLLLVLLTR